eukprot:6359832-Prymnesium_polylepis.1
MSTQAPMLEKYDRASVEVVLPTALELSVPADTTTGMFASYSAFTIAFIDSWADQPSDMVTTPRVPLGCSAMSSLTQLSDAIAADSLAYPLQFSAATGLPMRAKDSVGGTQRRTILCGLGFDPGWRVHDRRLLCDAVHQARGGRRAVRAVAAGTGAAGVVAACGDHTRTRHRPTGVRFRRTRYAAPGEIFVPGTDAGVHDVEAHALAGVVAEAEHAVGSRSVDPIEAPHHARLDGAVV